VPTITTDQRLAEMRCQIEELEARAQTGAAETAARTRHQLDELRQQEATARVAARRAAEAFTEQFEARLHVAESTVAADVAETREAFIEAVEDELHSWDSYLERLQAQTALRAASAREQVEDAIGDLRARRLAIAERLEQLRAVTGEAWLEQKTRLLVARDELERKADELSAKLRRR
jgi:hypothetical protein